MNVSDLESDRAIDSPVDVFISYSSNDATQAIALEALLRAQGKRVWRDRTRIKPGEHIVFVVSAALRDAAAVIAIWSEHSAISDWVKHEASYAAVAGKLLTVHVPPFEPMTLPEIYRDLLSEPLPSVLDNPVRLVARINELSQKGSRGRLKPRPTVFVERTEIHAHLTTTIQSAILANVPTALILVGPRGCGKSTMADDICDEITVGVHRVTADKASPVLTSACRNDLVFVDGFMDNEPKHQAEAEAWLRSIPANFLVVTTRRAESVSAVQRALHQSGTRILSFEIQGLTSEEFRRAIAACEIKPGCSAIRLSPEEAAKLHGVTGGLPLAVQLLSDLLRSPMRNDALTFLAALPPDEFLAELVNEWRREIVDKDDDLFSTLFTMANVPILGISQDAIAYVLDWEPKRVGKTVSQLWALGLISLVSLDDSALRIHDAIMEAFAATEDEFRKVSQLRKRYSGYCEGEEKSKSRISMVDSMIRASEALFRFAEREDFDAEPMEAYLIFLELRRLQINIIGDERHAEWRAERLASWLCQYVEENGPRLKCNELIAMGGVAQSLPIASSSLGESFAPLWERGLETDSTKVTAAMLASIRHLNNPTTSEQLARRIEGAFERQPWAAFGSAADIVAAGFAAAYAMIGQCSLGAAYLSGFRIRGRGISCSGGFAVLLLSIDAKQGATKANEFLHYNGSFCRDIDPVTYAYLSARGIQCPGPYYGGSIEENLNRQALWGIWSDNQLYCDFVARLLELSTKRSDSPPIFTIERADLNSVASIFSTVRS